MNEQIQQQVIELVQRAMSGDQEANNQIQQIMQAAQQGDQQAQQIAQLIQQVAQSMQQKARLGAKLSYMRFLKNECPEGYELQYFAAGGKPCTKCMKKGNKATNPIDAFKCGGKKMKKKEAGGDIQMEKCGKKLKPKKCLFGGVIDYAKCGKKLKAKKCAEGDKVDKKVQPKLINKKPRKKLDPNNTPKLPNGKYPQYWTGEQRATWDHKYGDRYETEGAGNVQNRGIGRN